MVDVPTLAGAIMAVEEGYHGYGMRHSEINHDQNSTFNIWHTTHHDFRVEKARRSVVGRRQRGARCLVVNVAFDTIC